jgi:ATP-binding cassette subfamily B (MDR/TAP) protein 1
LTSQLCFRNIEILKLGINYKISDFVYFLCRGAACLTLGIVVAWKFAVVFLVLVPLMILSSSLLATTTKKYTQAELASYESAGKIAQEVLSSLRSVISLGIQRIFINKYATYLIGAEYMSIKKGFLVGLLDGLNSILFNSCFVIGMFYGVYLTRVDCGNFGPSLIVTAFFSIMNTTFAFGQAFPFLKDLAEAKVAAYKIFTIIDTKSLISTYDSMKSGKKLDDLKGEIKLRNVCFSYPSRLDTPILQDLSLDITAGKTIALVGSSGSGKSTIVSLLQRFYMPTSGTITLDGEHIETLDVNWLRNQMALVQQEPILFSISIE